MRPRCERRPAVFRGSHSTRSALSPTSLSIRARRAGFRILVVAAALILNSTVYEDQRLFQRVYVSPRKLLEAIRKHASWAHWIIVVPNFPARWIGFFVAFAITRRCPKLVKALVRGVLDFATRGMGDRSCS